MLIVSLEGMFLSLEHEALTAASDSSYHPPYHPTLHDTTPLETPTPADPTILSQLYLRCSPTERCALVDTVRKILQPLLRRHRSVVRRSTWRAVCMRTMHTICSTIKLLEKSKPFPASDVAASAGDDEQVSDRDAGEMSSQVGIVHPAEARTVCRGGAAFTGACEEAYQKASQEPSAEEECSGEMPWALLDSGVLALHQFVTCVIHESMEEAHDQVLFSEESSLF